MWRWMPGWVGAWLLGTRLQLQQESVWPVAWTLTGVASALLVLAGAYWFDRCQAHAIQKFVPWATHRLAVLGAIALLACALVNAQFRFPYFEGGPGRRLWRRAPPT